MLAEGKLFGWTSPVLETICKCLLSLATSDHCCVYHRLSGQAEREGMSPGALSLQSYLDKKHAFLAGPSCSFRTDAIFLHIFFSLVRNGSTKMSHVLFCFGFFFQFYGWVSHIFKMHRQGLLGNF